MNVNVLSLKRSVLCFIIATISNFIIIIEGHRLKVCRDHDGGGCHTHHTEGIILKVFIDITRNICLIIMILCTGSRAGFFSPDKTIYFSTSVPGWIVVSGGKNTSMNHRKSVGTKAMHHVIMILWLSLVISRVQTSGDPGTSSRRVRGELRSESWDAWWSECCGGFLSLDAWGASFHLNGRNGVKDENRKCRHLSSLLCYNTVLSRSFRGLAVFQEYCAVLGATLLLISVVYVMHGFPPVRGSTLAYIKYHHFP